MPFFSCTTQKTPHIAAFFETLPPDVETRHIQQYLQNTSAGPSYIAYSARGRKEGAMLVLKLLAFVPPFRYMYICINLSHSFMSLYIFQFFYLSYYYKINTFSRAHCEEKVEEGNEEDQADQCGSEAESEDCTGWDILGANTGRQESCEDAVCAEIRPYSLNIMFGDIASHLKWCTCLMYLWYFRCYIFPNYLCKIVRTMFSIFILFVAYIIYPFLLLCVVC